MLNVSVNICVTQQLMHREQTITAESAPSGLMSVTESTCRALFNHNDQRAAHFPLHIMEEIAFRYVTDFIISAVTAEDQQQSIYLTENCCLYLIVEI